MTTIPIFVLIKSVFVGAKGISCFIVETGSDGLSFGKKEKKVIKYQIIDI